MPCAWRTNDKGMKTQTQKFFNLATVRQWAGQLSYRVTTNCHVFYGSLFLAASLVVGAITREHEELWRSAAALGIASVVIGLVHAWLDARADRRGKSAKEKD